MLLLLTSLLFVRNVIGAETEECPMQGHTPVRGSGTHNFVIDGLDGHNFPFAIGHCTATSISPSKWYKYFCEDDLGAWIVSKREYTDSKCTGDGEFVLKWETQFDTWQQYYECDGSNTYVQLELGVGVCQSNVTIYAGLASCNHDAEGETGDFEFYCNDTTTLVHYFGSYGNKTLMSTTGMPMSSTTALPLSSTNIMMSSTSDEVNMSTTELEVNLSTTDFPDLNMTTNFPIFSSLISTNFPISTNIITTLLSLVPTFSTPTISNVCDDSEYCDVWVLRKDQCSLAQASSMKEYNIFVKMKHCGVSKDQQTTGGTIQADKAGSILSPLAFSGILSLLFSVYWL